MGNMITTLRRFWLIVLIACSLVVLFFQLIFSQSISTSFSQHIYNQRKNSISKMVQLSYNIIEPIIERKRLGEIDTAQARKMISDVVRRMTYHDEFGDNYIFMSTYAGVMLVQPFETYKEGTNQWNLKDDKGNYIIQQLIDAAKRNPGGDFLTYYYYFPGKNSVEEKLSYVMGIPEIDAYIGTGMYVESSYHELERIIMVQRYGYAALTLFILVILMLYFKELVKKNKMLTREISDRERAEGKIRQLAYYDYLTGLPNRVNIGRKLEERLSACSDKSTSGAVYFIDIDNFKVINDTFGHSCGDKVLIEIAARISSLPYDGLIVSRIGGDEFIILQDGYIDEDDIRKLAHNILDIFNDPVNIGESSFHVGCSMGIAVYPQHGMTTEEILKNADLAMYKVKGTGKNGFMIYDYSMGINLSQRIEIENYLRQAFENNEFELYYQPSYDADRGRIVGFEALIRWNSPVYGMVMPGRFIGIAEEMGLINKIGQWVIERSFEFAKALQKKGICVSCNVSPMQLIQSNFVDDVIQAFDKYDLDRGSVALEITESILVESFGDIGEKLGRMRNKGILIYLDDFGTGYSSLTYLKKLPLDAVKIDKSFVDNVIDGGVETRIVNTVITLAHDMGLKVVAEGVETSGQFRYLSDCGCNYVQGYFIGKPMPESQALRFARQ